MGDHSKIEWTDATWNPIVGCSVVSPGCTNCYAMRFAGRRLKHTEKYRGLTRASKAGPVWIGETRLWERALTDPLRWRKPRKIFVNSEGDLFHESIPDEWIDRVFAVMALCPQHTLQVLTKRSKRAREYIEQMTRQEWWKARIYTDKRPERFPDWPLPNVWLGVSCEDQPRAVERIADLLATPAAVRFVSFEPLLGRIATDLSGIDWAIVGGESGRDARPMHPDWARALRDQCAEAGVAFFFKQWGEWGHGSSFAGDAVVVLRDGRVIAPTHNALEEASRSGNYDGWSPEMMRRVGRVAAGRLLDGREHNAFPGANQ